MDWERLVADFHFVACTGIDTFPIHLALGNGLGTLLVADRMDGVFHEASLMVSETTTEECVVKQEREDGALLVHRQQSEKGRNTKSGIHIIRITLDRMNNIRLYVDPPAWWLAIYSAIIFWCRVSLFIPNIH